VRQGKLNDAIAHFRRVLDATPNSAEVHGNLGRALAQKGKLDEAMAHWRKAIEMNPNYAEAYNDIGTELLRKGGTDEAIASWQKAVAVNPAFAPAYFNLGNALAAHGKPGPALAAWRKGLSVQPNHLPALSRTAWLLATNPDASLRNGAEAVALAERAARLTSGQDPSILDALAAAYAEAARFPEAVETANRAGRLAAQRNQPSLEEAIKERAALYEANTPFRDAGR
jgi:superkiller protein 3